ncbi:MAG: glycosyltransferase family 2 protein [Cyanobacteria bacterium P01_C01_bin.120]
MSLLKKLQAKLLEHLWRSKPHFRHPLSATLANRPRRILWGIDHPKDEFHIHTTLLIEGWAYAKRASTVVSVYIDGVWIQDIQPHLPRPDVAEALPRQPAAANSGFASTIHLEDLATVGEELIVTLAFRDRQGHCAVAERLVRVKEFQHPLSASLEKRPKDIHWRIEHLTVPHYETSGVVPIVGWACAQAGIKKIDLYIDGILRQSLQPSLARPDIAARFPTAPHSEASGFFATINIDDQPDERLLILAFHDQADRCAIAEISLNPDNRLHYHHYFQATLPSAAAAAAMLATLKSQSTHLPHFEWWINGEDTAAISATLTSIVAQNYPQWQCHIIAPPAQWPALEAVIHSVVAPTQRSQITLQSAVSLHPESIYAIHYIGFVQAGEILAPHALVRWAKALLSANQPDLSYADSDQIQADGIHCEVNFKPDWSPDYALSCNYVRGLYLTRHGKAVIAALSQISEWDAAATWRYDLWLQLTEISDTIHHVRESLWSEPYDQSPDSTINHRELLVVQAALRRRQDSATVTAIADGTIRRLQWPLPTSPPLVSMIIPTTGQLNLVQPLVESLQAKTAYPQYELIFLDNSRSQHPAGIKYLHQQGVRVIECDMSFNWSKLSNMGAAAAQGELLLFLNDDIEIIDANWLSELVSQAIRPDVGVVGGMLFYPSGHIQHGGVFLVNLGGGASHLLQYLDPQVKIYQNLNKTVREVSSNTGACFLVRRSIFEEMQGFDENFAIIGNDTDLALRIQAAGYRNLWTPFAKLMHHESFSRKRKSISAEETKFCQQWSRLLAAGDPFYNPNFEQDGSYYSLKEIPSS